MCVYDGLEPHNHYEPQQDTNNPIPIAEVCLNFTHQERFLSAASISFCKFLCIGIWTSTRNVYNMFKNV
jgi:hypothetical protein